MQNIYIHMTGNLCFSILHNAHYSRIGCHFKFDRILLVAISYDLKYKAWDVMKYVDGHLKFQRYNDSNQKSLTGLEALRNQDNPV